MTTGMTRTYPPGVTCWVDTQQPDLEAAKAFYGELLGWAFSTATPPQAPVQYVIAQLDGRDVAGLGSAVDEELPVWHTYVAVEGADATAEQVLAAGGQVLVPPADAGPGGRDALCADPSGARFHLWQARNRPGAQVTNAPGAWNVSDLHDPSPQVGFYAQVFGWEFADTGFATMVRVPGYGDHLESTVDPDIRQRQSGAQVPPGFEDAIGRVAPAEPGSSPHWHVSFTVADRDSAVATAQRLGAELLAAQESQWNRSALVRDPQGAEFTLSQFTPPAR